MTVLQFPTWAGRPAAILALIALLAACVPQVQDAQPATEPPDEVGGLPSASVAPDGVDPEVWLQVERDLAGDDLVGKDGPLAKVGLALALLYREYQAYLEAFTPSDPLVRIVPRSSGDGGPLVLIEAVAAEDPATLLADLGALGLEGAALSGRMVSGQLPILAIEPLAALPSLQSALPVTVDTEK